MHLQHSDAQRVWTLGGMWPLALLARRQELRERFQRSLGDVMLDAFRIGFRGFGGHA